MKPNYKDVLTALNLPEALSEFEAMVIGTPPLGIHTPASDIDIACHTPSTERFASVAQSSFGHHEAFRIEWQDVRSVPSVICNFHYMEWDIELFAQPVAINRQYGVRHFFTEKRLLELLGDNIKLKIIELKKNGLKTEPAFAQVLGLEGDAYVELLRLETMADRELVAMAEKQSSQNSPS